MALTPLVFNASTLGLDSATPLTFLPIIDVDVTVNITHPNVGDITITLSGPAGPSIPLSTNNGGAGANYTNTTFDDEAATAITAGAAPFTGLFRPESPLAALNGLNAIGPAGFVVFVGDNVANGSSGTFDSLTVAVSTPLAVVIDTIAPNPPLLDLTTASDTGRNNLDNVTNDNTPTVTMTTIDPPISGANLLFQDNLRYLIFDRFGAQPEFILYDSSTNPAVEGTSVVGDGLTSLNFVTETLASTYIANGGALNAAVLAGGVLADGLHNLKLEVLDRAGNISQSFLLPTTVDTTPPPVSFGQVAAVSTTDGLFDGSDTGVPTNGASFSDRVTSDASPTLWGLAEANSIVSLWLDANGDGIIQTTGAAADIFLGQTVANPLDGNLAFPAGYWQISSAIDLNDLTTINATGGTFVRDGTGRVGHGPGRSRQPGPGRGDDRRRTDRRADHLCGHARPADHRPVGQCVSNRGAGRLRLV